MVHSFLSYYIGTIISPGKTFNVLITDHSKLSKSCYAVLVPAILYTFVYLFLIWGGGQPFKPWLNIPIETYYRYNVFFCALSMFFGWVLATGVVHALSRIITQTGTFEETLSVFGFGISIASWATGIHDILTSFLGAAHVINQREYEIALNSPTIWRTLLWIQMSAYLAWFIVLFSKGLRSVYRMTIGQSVIFGIIGFSVYQFFFLVFNR